MIKVNTESQFSDLYEGFVDPVFKHCYFRVSDREKAKDLTQTVFERLWKHMTKGGDLTSPKAFIFRITNNLIIDEYRTKKDDSLDVLMEGGFDVMSEDFENIFKNLEGAETLKLLENLPEQYRDVLIMRYIDDLALSEIGDILGERENTIAVRIYRGIKKLKEISH